MEEQEQIISAYDNLSVSEKRKELANEFTELILVVKKLQQDMQINNENYINNDLKKLYDGVIDESNYLTNLYTNVINLKGELAEYLDKIVDLLYEE